MDHIFRSGLACIFVFLISAIVTPAHAANEYRSYDSMDKAASACYNFNGWVGSYITRWDVPGKCEGPMPLHGKWCYKGYLTYKADPSQMHNKLDFCYTVSPQHCAAEPSHHFGSTNLTAGVLGCFGGCQYGFTPDAGQVQVCIGGHCTSGDAGTVKPTGLVCDGTGTAIEDPGNYQPAPKPKLCGGGSCYDPGTQQYCAVDASGQQVCVSAPQAAQTGAQASSADSTVTAGNPPPRPSNPPIANPPTDIQSSDTYQQTTTDASGQPMPGAPITVNSYGAHGSTTSSGQSEGDMGPAPPSSSDGSKPGSVSGGLDCNSPPVCMGDAVNCAVVSQTWMARCQSHKDLDQLHKDLTDTGDFEKPGPVGQGDVWTDGSGGTGNAIAGNALQGHFDESGLGFSTQCPLHDLTVELPGGHSFVIPFTDGCQYGDWIRAVVIAFALFSAAKIVTGGRG